MYTRLFLAAPAAIASVTTVAYSSTASSENDQKQRPQKKKQVGGSRQKNSYALSNTEDVLDLKRHQRPPVGHAALNSSFAVELSSW